MKHEAISSEKNRKGIKIKTLLHEIQKREEILVGDSLFDQIHELKEENDSLIWSLNDGYKSSSEVRDVLEKICHQKIDQSVTISLPFQTDYGHHIQFGKDIFINKGAFFVDLGGITLEDRVLIGPNVTLITVNHITDPAKRRGISVKPIRILENAWLGAGVTILPGVTIGENAIVAANSTVTKDVPANVIVAGTPAKVIREI